MNVIVSTRAIGPGAGTILKRKFPITFYRTKAILRHHSCNVSQTPKTDLLSSISIAARLHYWRLLHTAVLDTTMVLPEGSYIPARHSQPRNLPFRGWMHRSSWSKYANNVGF